LRLRIELEVAPLIEDGTLGERADGIKYEFAT
jgi:hypothetical protein